VGRSPGVQRVHKLIWLKEAALIGIAYFSLGKYNNLDREESAIAERFNEVF